MNTSLATALAALLATAAAAQAPGLRIFQPTPSSNEPSQLVDTQGNVVHSWSGSALTGHIESDGHLVRGAIASGGFAIGGMTGHIERLALDGTVVWDYLHVGPTSYAHHDLEPMPNGNVLIIAWDKYTIADAIAAGRDPASITGTDWLPDSILELEPTGPTTANVVWQWHLIDHVVQDIDPSKPNYGVVANHPGLLDINYPPIVLDDGDWNHANGLDYDPVRDLIVISSRAQDEIYIIDHSTTTAEAASHSGGNHGKGGDILWRWGNPEAYDAGTAANQQLFGQHDPRFVTAGYPGGGNVTVYNNQFLPNQSAVHELVLPLDVLGNFVLNQQTNRYDPAAPSWSFTEVGFFSGFVSSAERLVNGNTLICSGAQRRLFEVDAGGTTVWSYSHPVAPWIFQTNYVDRSLWTDTVELAVGGGQVDFDHLVGSLHAGQMRLLLGSVTGSLPGTTLLGGVHLPLNIDYLTSAMVTGHNSGVFVETLRNLDGNGGNTSSLVIPAGFIPPALAGTQLDFAHVVFDATLLAVQASNPVTLTIVP